MSGGLQYELVAAKRAASVNGSGVLERNDDKFLELPDQPDFTPMRGSNKQVATEANRLNDAQTKYGFLYYLYSAEPVQEVSA